MPLANIRSLFRSSNRVKNVLDEVAKASQIPITRKVELLGNTLTLERTGICIFSKIRILSQGEEVYRIERGYTSPDDLRFYDRYEYFYNILRRQYNQNMFSFCEYCDLIRILERIPSRQEVRSFQDALLSTSQELGIYVDKKVLKMYKEYARRILNV